MRILVTGSAGFIGFHVTKQLLEDGHEVLGVDNLNEYYDPDLKARRLEMLETHDSNYDHLSWSMSNPEDCKYVHHNFKPEVVVHLAAQPGVHGETSDYVRDNLVVFANMLEQSRLHNVQRFVYASSSSVCGNGPFGEKCSDPISFYAATKVANEAMAKAYSHTYGMQTVGLRYFTVYGPWGRPDMAVWKFTEAVLKGEEVRLNDAMRDFTYIDDVVEGTIQAIERPLRNREVFNIGTGVSTSVSYLLGMIEAALDHSSADEINCVGVPPGEARVTRADLGKSREILGYNPKTSLRDGIQKFTQWYTEEYADKGN